jgi:hypothetical protein
MIDKKPALEQVKRFAGLEFYPTEREALQELLHAMQVASSEAIAKSFTADWLGYETACPKPAQIRIAIYDRNEAAKDRINNCRLCGGTGQVTVWFLVTYRGNSFVREKSEPLPDITTEEQANAFCQKIVDNPGDKNQDVLSAAKPCACRKVTA